MSSSGSCARIAPVLVLRTCSEAAEFAPIYFFDDQAAFDGDSRRPCDDPGLYRPAATAASVRDLRGARAAAQSPSGLVVCARARRVTSSRRRSSMRKRAPTRLERIAWCGCFGCFRTASAEIEGQPGRAGANETVRGRGEVAAGVVWRALTILGAVAGRPRAQGVARLKRHPPCPRGRARLGLAPGRHRSGAPAGGDAAAGRQSRHPTLAHTSRSLAAARRRAPGLRPPVRRGRSDPRRDRQGLRSGGTTRQHARGKTVIFVGVFEKVTDEFGTATWQPQMEGTKAGRELPGIVDQVVSMQLFGRDAKGEWTLDETSTERRLVCRSGDPWGLPAKDRSGRLNFHRAARSRRADREDRRPRARSHRHPLLIQTQRTNP